MIGAFGDWLTAVRLYQDAPFSKLGFRHVFGLQNLLHGVGWTSPPTLAPLAASALLFFWWKRKSLADEDLLGLLLCTSCLLIYAHDYDLAALAPFMIASMWIMLRRRPAAALAGLVLMLFMFFPQRVVRKLQVDLLVHFREPILLLIFLWLIALSLRWGHAARVPKQEEIA